MVAAGRAGPPPQEQLLALRALLIEHGLDTLAPKQGRTGSRVRLPLQHFDSAEHDPEDDIAAALSLGSGQPNAAVLVSEPSGGEDWRLGRVHSYDAKAQTFTARLLGSDGVADKATSVSAPRLGVYWLHEPVREFTARLASAHAARDRAEAEILFRCYVQSMPTTGVYTLSDTQVERLLERAVPAHRMPAAGKALLRSEVAEALVSEVRLAYTHSMNAMLLRHSIVRPPLGLGNDTDFIPAPPPPPPEIGVIAAAKLPEYPHAVASFAAVSSAAMPEVCRAVFAARHECLQLARLSLFDVKTPRTRTLIEYESAQASHLKKVMGFITGTWQPAIHTVVTEALGTGPGGAALSEPPPPPLQLPSIEGVGRGRVESAASAERQGDWAGSRPSPSSRQDRLSTQVNLMMSDALTCFARDSLHAYVAFLEGHAGRPGVPVLDPAYLRSTPLLSVELLVEKGEVGYSVPPEKIMHACLRQLDLGLEALAPLTELNLFGSLLSSQLRPLSSAGVASEVQTIDLRRRLETALRAATAPLSEYLESLRPHEEVLRREDSACVAAFASADDGEEQSFDLPGIEAKVRELRTAQAALDDALPDRVLIGTFLVDVVALKGALHAKHEAGIDLLVQLVAARGSELSASVSAGFGEIHRRLTEKPENIEALTALDEFRAEVPRRTNALAAELEEMSSCYDALEGFQVEIAEQDYTARWGACRWPQRLVELEEAVAQRAEDDRRAYEAELSGQQEEFQQELEEMCSRVAGFDQYTDLSRVRHVVGVVRDVETALADFEKRTSLFNQREALFGKEATDYQRLSSVVKEFEPYANLWQTADTWRRSQKDWLDGSLLALDPDDVSRVFEEMQRAMAKAVKTFQGVPGCLAVAKNLKEELASFSSSVQVVIALRNPGMRDRHWAALGEALGTQIQPDEAFTLRDATERMELHEPQIMAEVQKVCDRALKEFAIEKALDDMAEAWAPIEFDVVAYRTTGTSVVKVSDECNTLLDDHIVLTQQFSFSPHKGPFETRITDWETKLRLVQEVLSEWLACQRNWMYLQPIFDSEDIQRQLPAEAKRFSAVDKLWRKTIKAVTAAPHVLTFCDDDALLTAWSSANEELERVQKNLADYLETKRAAFARFYFLSNDELISILSQTKDPNAVQPHLRKCFEAIHSITMTGEQCEMSDMISAEKEVMPFDTPLQPKGSVELWMGEIETTMRRSVRKETETGIADYKVQTRGDFMKSHASMVAISVSQLDWTSCVELAISDGGCDGVRHYLEKMVAQLKELSLLVRTKLSKLQSKVMSAIIVMELHARDVVERLIEAGVSRTGDFEWVSQLRYYWEERESRFGPINMLVRMVQCTYPYGYEYLGASSRLVVTPLTDRCYMTLMGALHIKLGGAPAGPAGTGKTESVKDLAKALAKQCVVFNCSDGLDYKAMGKFFKGLSTAGAWACFDEFNRIDIEVLSVIAQQMLNIQSAIIQDKEIFEFEGSQIRLDPTTATFITMNPGYAGRTELPDNLKALFRPMAMMVPDYALIAEIRLFSFGFDYPKTCAQKLVSTFRLSSEQLSSQDHYDFGMRAVNTVINTAGLLKSRDPTQDEDLTMLRAIRDSNLPKFLSDDILLFRAIIKDIFPGVAEPSAEYADLEAQIKAVAEGSFKLQLAPDFLVKCIQLYEMTVVRHGMMLVGPTGGGKSRVLRVLQAAMSRVENDPNFNKVRVMAMNPKSITMNQLYGAFDLQTGEWTDGIAAVLIRHMSQPDTEETGVTLDELKWMVFDGPVDAIWIENMNTVLDDNKKLCLNSGEIIPLAETNRVIFEVEDLSVASPATVSRCGMIYIEPPYLLPSRLEPDKAAEAPVLKTWLQELPPPLDAHRNTLTKLVNAYVVPCTELLRLELTQPIVAPMPAVFANILRVLECYLFSLLPDPAAEPDAEKEEKVKLMLPKLVEPVFFVALFWGVGGLVDQPSRDKFDSFIREKMKELGNKAGCLPPSGSVFDYHFELEGVRWVTWNKTAPDYVVSPKTDFKADFNSLIIPTAASICYASLLDTLMSGNKHTVVIGPTGTAKSVTVSQYLTVGLPARYDPIIMAFSAQTSANQTQDILNSKFEKRRQGQDKDTGLAYSMWGPMLGKRFLVFVDDFNMPKQETYGAQPPVELMRQLIDTAAYAPPGAPAFGGGWYDRKTLKWKAVTDLTLIAAMGPPGGGRQVMTNRMLRHLHMLNFTTMPSDVIEAIFTTITKAFLENTLASELSPLGAPLVQATIGLYNKTCDVLRPMPSKPHYTFNLREISKVIQGVLMADKRRTASREDLARLWAHECQRVFSDRLINDQDRAWFLDETKNQMKEHLKLVYDKVVDTSRPLIYCDFFTTGVDPSIYEEVTSVDKLTGICKEQQTDYNEQHLPMSLVLFEDALGHVCRISRVLRQPSGNALLLGVGGSGRQSLTRLAAFIADFNVFQIEITKNYRTIEWREDLKTVLKMAGYEQQQVVFLFVDTQIADETFLENVNNILSSGEVPNLFEESDLGTIFEKMTQILTRKGRAVTKTALYGEFVTLVKKNLHVVMCMSPLGSEYTDRIRQFPSLINNTTTDWFSPWPPSALKAVARTLMSDQADTMEETVFASIVDICGAMHSSVREKSTIFLEERRRHNYVTPTSYLELISVIKLVLKQQTDRVNTRRNQLSNGLDKLNKTKSEVAVLKQQLAEQQPVLIETSAKVKEQQAQIAVDKEDALVIKEEAETSSAAAATKAAECKEIKDSAEAGLAEALPALDAAVKCLAKLDKSQIVEVKALKKPPAGVRLVLQAVCIMFAIKPGKIADPDNPQKKIEDYWGPSQKMLNDFGPDKFKQALIDFDKDNIPEAVIKLVEPICVSDEFQPEVIVKVSVACEAMCMWVQAMRKYYYVSKEVEPKRRQLAAAEVELKAASDSKAAAEAKLDAVTKKVAALEAALKEAIDKMASLEEQVERATVQLSNADKLIGGLGGEAKSWQEQVGQLSEQLNHVMGDALVCAGTISYLGPFTADYRSSIIGEWLSEMKSRGLPFTPDCTLSKILADPVTVRQWNIDGLPADAFSIENGIIMSVTKRWPLMIDPQGQANKFIKLSKAGAQLKTIKASDATKKIQQTLEMGIRVGQPVLLENVLETLDPFLEPVLANQTFKDASGTLVIKLGETVIPFHQDFNLQLTTVIPNPHYAPEVSVKVTLLNFAITLSGLEDQLLVQTVETERPDLAEKKNQLVVQNAENQRKLAELQDEILYLLSNSEGNILDDTNLIDTLAVSKTTSETILVAVAEAEIAENEIDETRAKYVPVAERGAILFFCISDLSLVDAMYQYSLSWFKALFLMATNAAEKSDDLDQRIANIINQSTYATYSNVCRSIFEVHKLMFSFTLCIKIQMGTGSVDLNQWRFLLAGGQLASGMAKPDASWLGESAWVEIINLATLPEYAGLDEHVALNVAAWRRLYDSPTPHEDQLPEPWHSKLNSFERLLVLRALRPDKCIPAVQSFVEEKLGRRFIEPPAFDLNVAFQESTVQMPLIFVLSTGSDPVKGLLSYAETAGMSDKLDYISLGQGQGPKAEKLIKTGKEQGRWILLMNCHLFISWLTTLEKEVEDIDPQKTDPNFRLWLTSMPSPKFPVSVLQNGVKMTNEPPKGLRANMMATVQAMSSERFDATNKPNVWRKVMFGLLLFNSVILERRKFGPLGWNITYQFTEGDTDATLRQAELLVNDYEEVPYKVIAALTSEVNYGGRVTDNWDRRTMANVLTGFANPGVLDGGYSFSPSGTYKSIGAEDQDGYMEYLTGLPVNAGPEVFGLHDNADITCAQNDTYAMFRTILSLQPRASSGGGKSREEVLADTAKDILDKVPEPFNLEAVSDRYPTMYEESMNTVVQQECIRYNKMLRVVLKSLKDVIKALKGEVVMTAELEAMGTSLFNNEVPQMWSKVAYPSLKPLGTWVPDLLSRLNFIQRWIDHGKPQAFWISGFYFPQAFITGTLQNHARKHEIAIDTVSFAYKMQMHTFEGDACPSVSTPPEDGAYIYGLFIEGARWDADVQLLQESEAKVLFTQLPVVHMLPEQHRKPPSEGVYACPIYKTLARFGTLSTTGHSTNFVMVLDIPCSLDQPQPHWVKRGVAGLLSLNF